jgi:hypothetical protein
LKILTEKSVDPSQRNDTQKLILVDLVEVDEDPGPQTSDPPTLTMRSKETEELLTLIRSLLFSIITLLYIGFGNLNI